MTRKVLAFDLEISRPLPPGDRNLSPFVGVSCVSARLSDQDKPIIWHAGQSLSTFEEWPYPAEMNPDELAEVAKFLLLHAGLGYEIVTWNGLAFDYDVLARGIGDPVASEGLARLALTQYDPAFLQVCQSGYMVKLAKIAEGLEVGSKMAGMKGALAPVLWSNVWPDDIAPEDRTEFSPMSRAEIAQGIEALGVAPGTRAAQEMVLKYVGIDANVTLAAYDGLVRSRAVYWITKKGTRSRRPWMPKIKRGAQGARLYNVAEALTIKEPNTSWMSSPPRPREAYYAWTVQALGMDEWEQVTGSFPLYSGPALPDQPALPEAPVAPEKRSLSDWPGLNDPVEPPRIVPNDPPPGF